MDIKNNLKNIFIFNRLVSIPGANSRISDDTVQWLSDKPTADNLSGGGYEAGVLVSDKPTVLQTIPLVEDKRLGFWYLTSLLQTIPLVLRIRGWGSGI